MDNIIDDSRHEHIQRLDDMYATDNLPTMIFLGMLMLIGFVGNSLVFLVHLIKMKPSTTRCFILALSLLDLISCTICISIDIVDNRYNYSFGEFGVVPCKLSAMLVTFSSYAAGNVLIAVGAVRHKKICYPNGPQTTVTAAKVAIFLSCVAAFVFAVPSVILYGGQTTSTVIEGVNGSLCTTSDEYVNSPYPLANNVFQFVTFIAGTVTMTTLYFRIWRTVSKFAEVKKWSWKYDESSYTDSNTPSVQNTSETVIHNAETSRSATTGQTPGVGKRGKPIQRKRAAKKYPSKRQMTARRTTLMLFIITLTFVVSYLPHLSLMATRAVHWEMIESLTGPSLAVYNFFLRSYFINCALNPIIYSYFNSNVRNEIKAVLCLKYFQK